jgi:hypothetical protein
MYGIVRLGLGAVFAYAGAVKLMDPMAFAQIIDAYGLVSWGAAKVLARALPVVEVAAGIALMADLRGALGLVVAQLLVFMGVVGYGMYMGLDVDCGCFGPAGLPPGVTPPAEAGAASPADGLGESALTLIRDGVMLAACLLLYRLRRTLGVRPRPRGRAG